MEIHSSLSENSIGEILQITRQESFPSSIKKLHLVPNYVMLTAVYYSFYTNRDRRISNWITWSWTMNYCAIVVSCPTVSQIRHQNNAYNIIYMGPKAITCVSKFVISVLSAGKRVISVFQGSMVIYCFLFIM